MRITRVVITVAAAGALLTGCGPASKPAAPAAPASSKPADNGVAALPANEILQRAEAAVNTGGTFRVKGTIKETDGSIALDLKVQSQDLIGSIAAGPVKVELLAAGTKRYVRPNAAFWAKTAGPKKAPTIAKLMGDKWVLVTAKDTVLNELFETVTIEKLLEPDGQLSKGPVRDIGGVPAIGLVDSKDKGTLYVATTGEPFPLRLEPEKPGDGELVFSDFGTTFTEVKAPPAAKVVDFSTLAGS